MEIRLLTREEIEPRKWDGCVYYALNSRSYAYTWYLDNVCEDWCGLVEGEYESVFPLVWNTKLLGYKQLYQPLLAQQLGLYSMHVCSPTRLQRFLEAIPSDIRYMNIQLNFSNTALPTLPDFKSTLRPNYILNLARPYEEIREGYSSNLRRNLKKAQEQQLYYSTDLSPETFVDYVRQFHTEERNGVPEALYHTALRVIYNAMHRGQGAIFAVFDEARNFCAGAFILFDGTRLVNLINVSSTRGRELNAMAFLFDALIKTNAHQLKIFDFEGSTIEGVARFYQSFGAVNEPYPALSYNRLPIWLRWAKK